MKYQYKFEGLVYPERVSFNLKGLPPLNYSFPDFKVEGTLSKFIIDNCKLSYIFESASEITDVATLKNLTERVVRVFIDSYCFVNSYNYDVVIDKVTCVESKLDYTFPIIGEFSLVKNELDFVSIVNASLLINSVAIGDCLSDFRRSIKYPENTAYYCHRAMETLRITFFDDESIEEYSERSKKGWRKMSKSIQVTTDSVFEKLIEIAKENRHGRYPSITYKDRLNFMTYTRNVVNKFIKWKLKNI